MRATKSYDAIVVGAGPNGLAAAIELARAGRCVCIFEANDNAGDQSITQLQNRAVATGPLQHH